MTSHIYKIRSISTDPATTNQPTDNPTFSPSNLPTTHLSTTSSGNHHTFTPSNVSETYPLITSTSDLITSTTHTTSNQHTSVYSSTTISTSIPTELSFERVSHATTESFVITSINDQHETSDDFITIILVIVSVMLCCVVVLCISAKYIMKKCKKKCQNIKHHQSAADMSGGLKVENINNLVQIQSSNTVKCNDSSCSNNNNMPISSIQSTTITKGETMGENSTDLKMQHYGIRIWLESISFPEYFDNFVLSGYESIEFIKEIQNKSELEEIGIISVSECNQILCEIEKLRMIYIHEMRYSLDEHEVVNHDTKTTDANIEYKHNDQYTQNEGETEDEGR